MRLICILAVALAVTGCAKSEKGLAFDGHYYRATAKKAGDDRSVFQVEVRQVSQSLEGAREAGRHAATKYCVDNFGTSNIAWTRGPDPENGSLSVSNDKLLLQGKCEFL
ncbi:hypothetical protein SAMN05444149_101314 [Pseudosulfitobacter pseudonitzschiae]|uniref:Lipoprotein n=1 Tax=Pseudosulfitobacter pseudonitzschiae TaxID=1402135 RepID=A0A073J8E8_9RHOB|nr:hypothetical protein [Pseudosulfitobacter pseudonitzschiae]KEJ97981.1 hypothetical protein SUH3_03050 [Pseudosulfitobacter pseudonitzschiae]QKS09234.1 hypothetical protein HT745_12505 [Pseudosulfitobacter pseudonitzschiae]SHE51090.1 hypothetical protein SAMN05444149_101314 [Pseudosulfitobacter pseudonitzschiae]